MSHPFLSRLETVTTLAFDVDGVFTDGTVTMMPDGTQLRRMLVKDGYAIQLAMKAGLRVVIISGGSEPTVRKRFEYLGVEDIYLGCFDKRDQLEEYLLTWDVSPEQVLYMGDDLPDFEAMQYSGVRTCPSNAAREIKAISHYISDKGGGNGCVRDIIEKVLKTQNKWPQQAIVETEASTTL